MKSVVLAVIVLFLFSCQSDEKDTVKEIDEIEYVSKFNVKYAKGFEIEYFDGYKVLTLKNAWKDDAKTYQYVLYKNEKPGGFLEAIFIKTPIKSIACMSLTHVAFLEKLGLEKSIIALSGCDYVSSPKIKNLIDENKLDEIGSEQSINYEMLVDKSPDFIMTYGINSSSNTYLNKMKELGLTVVLNAEYMETHPLGKAEWIKFVAAFYEEDDQANNLFAAIEKEYLSLLSLTKELKKKPTVFSGMPWNGSWYVPGAKSFQVQLFNDAGANFLWMNNDETGSMVKAKEIIIDEAYEADFWLNQNSYKNVASILDFDEKFKGFNAVKRNKLFNNDNRVNGRSGNDYWESGVVNPHVVLKDLIKIFHPKLINHNLYYYRRLD